MRLNILENHPHLRRAIGLSSTGAALLLASCQSEIPVDLVIPTVQALAGQAEDAVEGANIEGVIGGLKKWASEPVTIGGSEIESPLVPPTSDPSQPTVGETLDRVQPTIAAMGEQALGAAEAAIGSVTEIFASAGNRYIQKLEEAKNGDVTISTGDEEISFSISDLIPSFGSETGEIRDVLPDPGPGLTETIRIVRKVALERGIPPEVLMAKLWYEGGYFVTQNADGTYSEVSDNYPGAKWIGLRNVHADGTLIKSPSEANCGGIGQVCTYWHPDYDEERARTDLEYAVTFAADFFGAKFDETGSWSAAVKRYHSPDEAQKGLDFTTGFLTNPPLNPETGQPAWEAQNASILDENTRRPIPTAQQIAELTSPPEASQPKETPISSTPEAAIELADSSSPKVTNEPMLRQWAQFYQDDNVAPWKLFVAVCMYRGCDPNANPEGAQEIWNGLNLAYQTATDESDTEAILQEWAEANEVSPDELTIISSQYNSETEE